MILNQMKKITINQLRKIISEEIKMSLNENLEDPEFSTYLQHLEADRNNIIEKLLDIQLSIENQKTKNLKKNSPEWHMRRGELHDNLKETLGIDWTDDLSESWKDKLKSGVAKVGLAASLFAGNAHANPESFSDQVMQDTDDKEDEVILQDDEGNDHKFYWVTAVSLNGKQYAALELADGSEEDGMLFLFRYIPGGVFGDEESFTEIKDEKEWESVRQAVDQKLESEK